MSTGNPTHPFTLEVVRSRKGDGSFEWTIRKSGKLLERSDRIYRSEAEALKSGQNAIERQLQGDRTTR